MFALQPVTIVKVVSAPTPQVTVVDIIVDALGLTGLIVIGSLAVGAMLGALLIARSKRQAAARGSGGAQTDHTSLDLSSPPK